MELYVDVVSRGHNVVGVDRATVHARRGVCMGVSVRLARQTAPNDLRLTLSALSKVQIFISRRPRKFFASQRFRPVCQDVFCITLIWKGEPGPWRLCTPISRIHRTEAIDARRLETNLVELCSSEWASIVHLRAATWP